VLQIYEFFVIYAIDEEQTFLSPFIIFQIMQPHFPPAVT